MSPSSSSSSSTRWCPTPEQLMILEELYKRGVRTPNASQIQKITAHLSYYGKIQGKNVFYWFQNHKARDRQKLRKKLAKQQQQQQYQLQQHLYPLYQHDHQITQFNHHLPTYPSAFHHFSNSYLPEYFPSQGTAGACEPETQRVVMKQNCRSADLPKDFSTEMYGQDLMMYMEADPISSSSTGFHCCRSRPLETLDLFPLTSQQSSKGSS